MSAPLIVGSIAIDNIHTPLVKHNDLLGGSASYACVAASFYGPVKMVGVVGKDFPREYIQLFKKRKIDIEGLQIVEGKTFRWTGEYELDMNRRRTLSVELNVFEHFSPKLPDSYRDAEFVLLGNIAPSLQSHVLNQLRRPKFVIADTMDLWIETTRKDLVELLGNVDAVTLNDSEARMLTEKENLVQVAQEIQKWGPKYVIIKKGEHGALMFSRKGIFVAPAYPLEAIHDPTGAGDCFAGGIIGQLARRGKATETDLRHAIVHGSAIASYNVEEFSLNRLRQIKLQDVARRVKAFEKLTKF